VAADSIGTGSTTTYKAAQDSVGHLGHPSAALHLAYHHRKLSGLALSIASVTRGQERSQSPDGTHLRASRDPSPISDPGASQPIRQRLGTEPYVHRNTDGGYDG